jgi:RNA recognition motif-containing protein
MNIFVGNLSYQATEEQLQNLFAEFGNVKSVKIIKDNYTSRSRGFGFVEMPENAEAEKAIEKLNGSSMDQQVIVVNEARPRTENSRDSFSNKNYNKRY